jgi:hypothetical protein
MHDYRTIIAESLKAYYESKIPAAKEKKILQKNDVVRINDTWPSDQTDFQDAKNEGPIPEAITILSGEGKTDLFRSPIIFRDRINENGEYLVHYGEYSLPIMLNVVGTEPPARSRLIAFLNWATFGSVNSSILYFSAKDYYEDNTVEARISSDFSAQDSEMTAVVRSREGIINLETRLPCLRYDAIKRMTPIIIVEEVGPDVEV